MMCYQPYLLRCFVGLLAQLVFAPLPANPGSAGQQCAVLSSSTAPAYYATVLHGVRAILAWFIPSVLQLNSRPSLTGDDWQCSHGAASAL